MVSAKSALIIAVAAACFAVAVSQSTWIDASPCSKKNCPPLLITLLSFNQKQYNCTEDETGPARSCRCNRVSIIYGYFFVRPDRTGTCQPANLTTSAPAASTAVAATQTTLVPETTNAAASSTTDAPPAVTDAPAPSTTAAPPAVTDAPAPSTTAAPPAVTDAPAPSTTAVPA